MSKPTPNNTGKVHVRQSTQHGSTCLVVNLGPLEASMLRSFITSVRLKGDKVPSMSLIARRAVSHFLAHAQSSAETRASEIAALEKMATPYPDRALSKPPPNMTAPTPAPSL